MPLPALDGGAQVMHFTTQGLLLNNIDIKVLAINPTRNFVNINYISKEYLKSTRFESVKVDTEIKPINIFINLLGKESYFIERFLSQEFKKKLQTILESEEFDIIQLEHLYLSKYIKTVRKYSQAKVVLRPQNIEYIIWERYIKGVRNLVKKFFLRIATSRMKAFEQTINNQLDGIIALTKQDSEIFKSFSGKTPVIIIPMGYDYEKLKSYDFEKQYVNHPSVYHLGSMDWLPNEEAMQWFFEKVLPHVEQKKISVKFSIAGKKMPSWAYRYKSQNIDIQGEINDPLKFQEDKSIMIVPLLSGSGIRAKIIEGLALGKTIISTTIGAQGIEYENGKNILIGDTPEQFANQIIRSVSSPALCREIGHNARKLSFEHYHYENTAKKMIDFYKEVLKTNG